MSDTLRESLRAIAVRLETTSGTDPIGGTPAVSDYIGATFTFSISQDAVENPEESGSLDVPAPIATGLRGAVEIRVPLRGSGVAATAPEWGRLLQVCGWRETVNAAAVGAPTAATAGSATTVTLGAIFGTTAQQYRGFPLLITGTPANALSFITDYTAGRVATLADTFAPPLAATALCQIPPCVVYSPTSDEALFRTATVYLYEDGLRHRLVGCVGSWRLELEAGRPGALIFSLRGQVLDAYQAAPLPAAWNTIARQPLPLWLAGKCQFNRATARTDAFRFDAGVALQDIENPEAVQGYDPPIMSARAARGDLAPYATTTHSPGRFAALVGASSVPFASSLGSLAGNRIGFCMPSNRIASMDRTKRGELGADQITIRPDLGDAAAFIAHF